MCACWCRASARSSDTPKASKASVSVGLATLRSLGERPCQVHVSGHRPHERLQMVAGPCGPLRSDRVHEVLLHRLDEAVDRQQQVLRPVPVPLEASGYLEGEHGDLVAHLGRAQTVDVEPLAAHASTSASAASSASRRSIHARWYSETVSPCSAAIVMSLSGSNI